MDARILEIVFYLMDHIEEGDDQTVNISDFSSDLRSLGYSDEEISSAYNWVLDHFSSVGDDIYHGFSETPGACRILTEIERARLEPQAYGMLLKLTNVGVLSGEHLERVLDRLTLMGSHAVGVDQVKLLVTAVLFNESTELDAEFVHQTDFDLSTRIN
ncbi:DUF494 family protein [candidate division GN15 bacterium]|nr:DUF494 family protein [candidate division GN15 bacterium]